ncbi:hypothetical protein THII_3501 [Thioploca ingrica]|uniref:Uncharacterized protein n=1 Tax=Thioploca ingrica TaxID=40754 RepID=A0A090AHL1_9GAMM|nr:hypothetical protein THII_3501 [Thioploca ingrica]
MANKVAFFQFVDHHTFTLPPDYQFHREELYEGGEFLKWSVGHAALSPTYKTTKLQN